MDHWDLVELFTPPRFRVLENEGDVQSVVFEHEPYLGHPTEVFAYVGTPRGVTGLVPAMVCVHGGLGAAFRTWVEAWVQRGYAAIAMDLNGCGAKRVPLNARGPAMEDEVIFNPDTAWSNSWTYHAVAAVLRAHTLLRGFPKVDCARVGITGVSWGGYLTCLAASLDPRLACAIPVYGCGFLQANSASDWMKRFAVMSPTQRATWHARCDPSVYLANATAPMLFVSGTDDFAYPLDSVQKTYALPRSSVTFSLRPGMKHSQEDGIAPVEIALFADQHLRGGETLPAIGNVTLEAGRLCAPATCYRAGPRSSVHYTTDGGRWQDRKWQNGPACLGRGTLSAGLPHGVSACFLGLEDERGAFVSSAPIEIRSM